MKSGYRGFALICPNCDSMNTKFVMNEQHQYLAWECIDCGVYPETEEDERAWRKYQLWV